MLHNQIRFDSEKFGSESIIQESTIVKFEFSQKVQLTYPLAISKTELFLQDKAIDLDDLTELQDASVFKFQKQQIRIRNIAAPEFLVSVQIEMGYDLNIVVRTTYNFLDLLSDVGGV